MLSQATPPTARRGLVAVLAAAALLVAAAPASADTFDEVFKDYAADGQIDPCDFTTKELNEVRDDVPPDIEQYAPDFPAALTLAIEARGKGGCAKAKAAPSGSSSGEAAPAAPATPPSGGGGGAAPAPESPAPPTPDPTAATPVPETPQPAPAPVPAEVAADGAITRAAQAELAAGRSDDLPAAIVGLGVLAVLLALTGIAWLLARTLAWDPAWGASVRHACEEAGWRVSGTWSDFTDWIRLGR